MATKRAGSCLTEQISHMLSCAYLGDQLKDNLFCISLCQTSDL